MTAGIGLYVIAAHLVGDFILQTGWMAREKLHPDPDDFPIKPLYHHAALRSTAIRTAHVAVYLLPFIPVVYIADWPMLPTLGAIGGLHWWTDFTRWVEPREGFEAYPVVVDQTLHIASLALVVAVSS